MSEADPFTMVSFATDAALMAMQAGPPTDLPARVPEFVGNILGEIGSSAGDATGGIGDAISGLTPGGSEAADGAGETASGAAANAPGR